MSETLTVRFSRLACGDCLVCVRGELDLDTRSLFLARMALLLAEHRPRRVHLDLTGLTFCDCAGLRAIQAVGRLGEARHRVRVTAASQCVDLILRLCHIEHLWGHRPA
ncbi:STAS domain-containing protein [Actinoplanes sp. NPDC023714]|uniref:STAS domain-containing protein n=1 Tax=Actinoplanes sp. NPDC023714 TaxID=3154322 RepID=UPI0033C3DA35